MDACKLKLMQTMSYNQCWMVFFSSHNKFSSKGQVYGPLTQNSQKSKDQFIPMRKHLVITMVINKVIYSLYSDY